MLKNGIRKLVTLTAILACVSLMMVATGCDQSAQDELSKVQSRAAFPRIF